MKKFNSFHPSRSKGKYIGKASINKLPNEILLEIFKKLNIKDLCTCSQVCKMWHEITSMEAIWERKYRELFKYRSILPGMSWKRALIERGLEERNSCLQKCLNKYKRKLDSNKKISISDVRLSLVIHLTDEFDRCIYKNGELLPLELRYTDTQATFPRRRSKSSSLDAFPKLSKIYKCKVFLAVPFFPGKIMPYSRSPRHFILLNEIDLTKPENNFKKCTCMSNLGELRKATGNSKMNDIIDFHTCIDNFAFALWHEDKELAFIAFTYLTTDILDCLFRAKDISFEKESISESTVQSVKSNTISDGDKSIFSRYTGSAKSENALTKSPDFDMFDLSGDLVFNNFNGDIILAYYIRSFTCMKTGNGSSCVLLKAENRGDHIPFDAEPIINWHVDNFGSKIQNVIVIKMVVEDRGKNQLWVMSKPSSLIPMNPSRVQYDYTGSYFCFEAGNNKGKLSGIVLKNDPENDDMPYSSYLIELKFTFHL